MAIDDVRRANRKDVKSNLREQFIWIFDVTDQDGDAVDLSGKELVYSIREQENSTALLSGSTTGGEVVVSGVNNNRVTITLTLTGMEERSYYHDLENTTDDKMILDGFHVAGYGAYGD